jgi:hypothetical protein
LLSLFRASGFLVRASPPASSILLCPQPPPLHPSTPVAAPSCMLSSHLFALAVPPAHPAPPHSNRATPRRARTLC